VMLSACGAPEIWVRAEGKMQRQDGEIARAALVECVKKYDPEQVAAIEKGRGYDEPSWSDGKSGLVDKCMAEKNWKPIHYL
jgi:hypothetical protein